MTVLRTDLGRAKGRWLDIVRQAGVNHSTISRVYRGVVPAPRIDTYMALRAWLDQNLPASDNDSAAS